MTVNNPFTKEYSADVAVERNLHDYACYNAFSKLPSEIDGLKRVHRRLLWRLSQYKEDTVDALSYLGSMIDIHPHGDGPTYDALIRMLQPWSMGIPLANAEGNKGQYIDVKRAAAPRYLEITKSEFTKDMFFADIHPDTIPMMLSETKKSMEPIFLIPKLPMALVLPGLTIGVGFKSVICPLNLKDVCEIVKRFVDNLRSTNPLSIEKLYQKCPHLFLPDFPIRGEIRNVEELLQAYRRNDYSAPVRLDGLMQVEPNSIIINTLAYGADFDNVQQKLKKAWQDKKCWLNEAVTDFVSTPKGKDMAFLEIQFKRNISVFSVLDKFKAQVRYSNVIHPKNNFITQEERICNFSPLAIILRWFAERKRSVQGTIKAKQAELMGRLLLTQALYLVVDHHDEVIQIVRNSLDEPQAALQLADRFELTLAQAKALASSKLSNLAKGTKAKLAADMVSLSTSLENQTAKLNNVLETIYDDALYFDKKYGKPRLSKITSYMGCIIVNGEGVIQFDDTKELLNLLVTFRNQKVHVQIYQPDTPYRYLVDRGQVLRSNLSIPHQTRGTQIIESPIKEPFTLCFRGDGTVSVLTNLPNQAPDDAETVPVRLLPITEKFTGIQRNGALVDMSVTDLKARRKATSKGSISTLISAIPSTMTDVVVLHMNTGEPNVLRMDRVIPGESRRMVTAAGGDTVVLGIFPYMRRREIVVTVPPECTNLNNLQYIHIGHLSTYLGDKKTLSVKLERRSPRQELVRTMALL